MADPRERLFFKQLIWHSCCSFPPVKKQHIILLWEGVVWRWRNHGYLDVGVELLQGRERMKVVWRCSPEAWFRWDFISFPKDVDVTSCSVSLLFHSHSNSLQVVLFAAKQNDIAGFSCFDYFSFVCDGYWVISDWERKALMRFFWWHILGIAKRVLIKMCR